jgi:hypothetical protein
MRAAVAIGDLYLDKLNKNHLTRNLVHRLERLGYCNKPHRLVNFHDRLHAPAAHHVA